MFRIKRFWIDRPAFPLMLSLLLSLLVVMVGNVRPAAAGPAAPISLDTAHSRPGAMRPAETGSGAYRLQSGDILHLEVINPVLQMINGPGNKIAADLLVQPDGRVNLPMSPPRAILARGLTVEQFETKARQAFSHYVRNPMLVVTVQSTAIPVVYLVGSFQNSGAYPIQGSLKALDAVAMAGGAPAADLTQVVLTRGHSSRTLDLQSALDGRDAKDNINLQPADVLFVPEMRQHVTIQGQVTAPRNIPYKPGMNLEEALAAAGGPTDKADVAHVAISHQDGSQTRVDLKSVLITGDSDTTPVRPGDVITLPEAREHILVMGEVAHPEPIPFQSDLTLDSALALSGGETPRADLSHVKLARVDPPGVQTVDLAAARREGKATSIRLQAGDMITVPEMTAQVFVLGAVDRPGPVQFRAGMTLLEALSGASSPAGGDHNQGGAGGPTDRADYYHVLLTQADGGHRDIDLDRLIRRGDASQNVVLEPGDTLYVPETKQQVYVFGAVARQGVFVISEAGKNRLLDVLQLAGGATSTSDIGRAELIQPVSGVPTARPLHLDQLLKKGQLQYNVVLQPGDVVYIPDRKPGSELLPAAVPSLIYSLVNLFHL